ncbi:MAG: AtpZ/AtpI family protein [Sphingopyxis sp.]
MGDRQNNGSVDHDRRLDSLDKRLDRLEASEATRTGRDRQAADPNMRMGSRVLADLIGGIAGGALLGWLADRLLNSSPWGFLIFLSLGIVVAFRNIIRIANGPGR